MREVAKSVPKLEGMGLAAGKPAFTNDMMPRNALVIKVLRSPHPFARITDIDTNEAERLPGVKCVLTYKNVPRNIVTRAGQGYPEPSPHDKFILDEYVRYVGDEVAAVAAKDRETAEKALKLIKVSYQVIEPVLDFESAEGHPSVIHSEKECHEMFPIGYSPSKNIAAEYNMSFGDVDGTFGRCEHVVSESYYTQAQAHCAMEPNACYAYIDVYGRLTLVSSTQVPFHVRRIVGEALNLPLEKIRVIKPRVGGGYGNKQSIHGEMIAALVALRTGMAAGLEYTREEVFEATYTRHQMRIDVTMGADRDGNIKAIDMKVLSNTGAYGEHALTVFMVTGSKTLPIYNKAEAVRFGGKVVYTNLTPAGAFRGYGAVQGNFALEAAIDKLAEKAGIDPMEFRMRNMIGEGETSPIFRIMGEGREGVDMVAESCKLEYCIKRGMEVSGWKEKYPRVIDGSRVRGIGGAIAMQGSGIPCVDMASAAIKLNDRGFFNLIIGATDIGTGSDTILAQIAAEALEVPVSKVVVYSSDTDITPFDCGAYASSTTFVSGNAVKKAGLSMKKLIEEKVSQKFGVPAEKVSLKDGILSIGDENKTLTLEEFATELYYSCNQQQLMTCESFCGEVSPPPYMAGFAEVEVDTETGKVDVLKYTGIVDCGTTINPNLARIQVEGGLLQGIGMTLFERADHTNDGRLINNSFTQYGIPTRKDGCSMDVEFASSFDPSGPYGAKSVGEIGIDTPPAAITNAIYNATGVRVTKLPVSPEELLREIKKRRG